MTVKSPAIDRKIAITTWGDEKEGVLFYKAGRYLLSQQWRTLGDDKISVAIPLNPLAKKLIPLLNSIDWSDEQCGDRWILIGRIIDTPPVLRKAGCTSNKIFLVNVGLTRKMLIEAGAVQPPPTWALKMHRPIERNPPV